MKLCDVIESKSIPFTYAAESSASGSGIGGASPVLPQFGGNEQKFFGTLKFTDFGVSLFYSLDKSGANSTLDMLAFNNKLLLPSELIHAVIHPLDDMGANEVPTEVSCHALRFQLPVEDIGWDALAPTVPYPKSKLGGVPFVDNIGRCSEAFESARELGFRQLVQFDTPHPRIEQYVKGFPWDPGWLHVFIKVNRTGLVECAFIIQQ